MERIDRVVAFVGALVLVTAVGVAAMRAPEAGQEYALSYASTELETMSTISPEPVASSGKTFLASLDVGTHNVSRVDVTFTLKTANAQGGSMRATLTAPNGTLMAEDEISLGSGSPGTSATAVITLEADLSPLPTATRGAYASLDEAKAALAQGPADAAGVWQIEMSFAPGATPALQVEASYEARALTWTGDAAPVVPTSR